MPEGQFLGNRGRYVYTDDAGAKILLTLDNTLVMVNSGLEVYDPENPPAGCISAPGPRFKERVVFWEGTEAGFAGKRKELISGTNNSGLYATNLPVQITLDQVTGITTGRRGERRSF